MAWTEHKDKTGRVYYYNAATQQSRWDKPPAITSPAQQALDNCAWKEYSDQASSKKYYYNTDSKETTWVMPGEYRILLERLNAEIKNNLKMNTPQLSAPTVVEFKTKEDAEDCFFEMLEEFAVDLSKDWTWPNVIRKCHQHKFYRALKSVNERMAVYDRYIVELKEKEEVLPYLT